MLLLVDEDLLVGGGLAKIRHVVVLGDVLKAHQEKWCESRQRATGCQ